MTILSDSWQGHCLELDRHSGFRELNQHMPPFKSQHCLFEFGLLLHQTFLVLADSVSERKTEALLGV